MCAYMGDTIYEWYIREYLINKGITKVGTLQQESLNYVSAKSQRRILEELMNKDVFTEEELEILKWGRNAKGTRSKSTDIITYRMATSLEALIGKLYCDKKEKRIEEIMKIILGD